jgi:alpha-mannosidase
MYFDSIRSQIDSAGIQLPIVLGELRSSSHTALLPNVLSTRIWIKQRNHDCENELVKWIEPINAWTTVLNPSMLTPSISDNLQQGILENRNAIIRHAWKTLMQCHPHDSICGTSIDQVANEMRVRFDQVDQINHELGNQCFQVISDQIDTRFINIQHPSETQPNILSAIVVFNPNDAPQTGLVNINLKLDNQHSSYVVIDEQGNLLPYDQVGLGARELISMTLDKRSMKQTLGMIHEGAVAGMVIRDFVINQDEKRAFIRAILSDHGEVDRNKWNQGVAQLDSMIADPGVTDFIIHAFSDPEINLSLVARDVPGHGYRCYWLRNDIEKRPLTSQQAKLSPLVKILLPVISPLTRIPLFSRLFTVRKPKSANLLNAIENEFFKVEVRQSENTISITDMHMHLVYTGLNRFVDSADSGDLYNYCPVEHDLVVSTKINKVELDVQKTCQKLTLSYDMKIPARIADDRRSRSQEKLHNTIKSTLTVIPGVPRIDIHTEIDNNASDHRLRVHFPALFSTTTSWQDGHFEIVQRQTVLPMHDDTWEEPPRLEVPQAMFTAISNEQLSLTIANRGLPEVEIYNNESGNTEIAITLLRCVGWLSRDDLKTRKGHAGPMGIATPDAQMIGKFSFDYSIIPGGNDWRKSLHHAYSFNASLKPLTTSIHSGMLPSRCSFIENQSQDFVITAIKQPEYGSGVIVRGFNTLSSPIDVSLKLWRIFNQAQLVSLDEKVIETLSISSNGSINLNVGGNKIITILFKD